MGVYSFPGPVCHFIILNPFIGGSGVAGEEAVCLYVFVCYIITYSCLNSTTQMQ